MENSMHHKANLLFLSLLLAILSWQAQAVDHPDVRAEYPYAVAESRLIDMGVLEYGSRATGEIKLSNAGEKELTIAKVRSSCGLMIPTWPGEPIGKDEQVDIRFSYDTSRLGPFERKVVIHTNAWQKTIVVTIRGEVVP